MKRFLLIPVLSLLLGQASAQIPIPFLDSCFFYQRVCILEPDNFGLWPQISFDSVPPNRHLAYDEGFSYGHYGSPTHLYNILFIEEYGSRIYGIAICADTDQIPERLGLGVFDKNLQLLGSVNGDEAHYCKNTLYTYAIDHGSQEVNVPCQIHLFNEPVVLPDTFFLSFYSTTGGNLRDYLDEISLRFLLLHHLNIELPVIHYIPTNNQPWEINNTHWGGYFPIRELPCPVGPEPSLVAALSGQTVLGWQTGDTTLYLLDFYDEDGRLLFESDTLSQTSYVLSDSLLDAAGYHESGYLDVRLRRACSYMTSSYHSVVWSPWSAPRRFYHQRGVEGLTGVVMPELTASPNPATGMLRVEGEEGLLQMLDLEGREVLTRRLHERGTTLDVSALPRGVYLLRLVSDTGTATRRVVLL